MSLKSICCDCYLFSSSKHLWKGKVPKSLLVWFPSFRPGVAGNTGKFFCPDRPRAIPRLPISINCMIHFSEHLYNLCDTLMMGGKGPGWEPLRTYWPLEPLTVLEFEQTVGELRQVLEGRDPHPCPKSALCTSILENSFSFCFLELMCLSPTRAVSANSLWTQQWALCTHICTGRLWAWLRNFTSASRRRAGPWIQTVDKGLKYLCTKMRKNIQVNVINPSWVTLNLMSLIIYAQWKPVNNSQFLSNSLFSCGNNLELR